MYKILLDILHIATFKINELPGGKNVWHILWRNKNIETVVTIASIIRGNTYW